MRAIADGELEVNRTFADEMSYCLGCLACQTACPAGVNYGVLFETARSDIRRANVDDSARRRFWRGLTLNFLFMRPRALRGAGRMLRLYQRSGLEALARRLEADQPSPGGPAPARAAGAGDCRAVLGSVDRGTRGAAGPGARARRAADRLRAGPGLPRHQPRHRRRGPGQRLRGRNAAITAVLRLAARAQRRAGHGADPRAAPDRPRPAGAIRRDHQQRRRLRVAPAALRHHCWPTTLPTPSGRSSGTASCATFRNGSWKSVAAHPRSRRSIGRRRSRITSRVTWCTARRSRASRARC